MSNKNIKIEIEGKTYEYPVIEGTEHEKAFDISKLRDQTGYITMDNGFANTSTCKSAITYLDGENGVLHYRGYPIEQLAEKSTFLEVSYMLIYGALPTPQQLETFSADMQKHADLPPTIVKMYDGFPKDAHPMAMVSAVVCALAAAGHALGRTVRHPCVWPAVGFGCLCSF